MLISFPNYLGMIYLVLSWICQEKAIYHFFAESRVTKPLLSFARR